jgi:hypothetical protein
VLFHWTAFLAPICFFFFSFCFWPCQLSRQVLYHLSHAPALFAFRCFSNRVSGLYLARPGLWPSYLPILRNWDDRYVPAHPVLYWLWWGLYNFLPRMTSNHDLPISASRIARITGVSSHTQLHFTIYLFIYLFILVVLELELRASCLLGLLCRHPITWATATPPHFAIFKGERSYPLWLLHSIKFTFIPLFPVHISEYTLMFKFINIYQWIFTSEDKMKSIQGISFSVFEITFFSFFFF